MDSGLAGKRPRPGMTRRENGSLCHVASKRLRLTRPILMARAQWASEIVVLLVAARAPMTWRPSLGPPPLRERAPRRFNNKKWVRGWVPTPNPQALAEIPALPSPAGERARLAAPRYLTFRTTDYARLP
jgi:hypothetical protein